MLFNVGFVRVTNKVHVDLSVSQLTGVFFFFWVERVFFFEVVEILVADLGCDGWLVGSCGLSDVFPIKTFYPEKGVSFDLFNPVLAKAFIGVRD